MKEKNSVEMTILVQRVGGRDRRLAATLIGLVLGALLWATAPVALAQSVGLPSPRLLTTLPMGGTAGGQVEVTITGEHLDEVGELTFSTPKITAQKKLGADGKPEPLKYVVSIAADCPVGLHEARVTARLGVSSSRAFSVGALPEVTALQPRLTTATAMELKVGSVCNAVMTVKSVDHYWFEGRKGQRIVADCAARGIDSKLDPVLIIGDAQGRDLVVERRGGVLDYSLPQDGKYTIKVHELTFKGGPAYFYRLALSELPPDALLVRQPATLAVNSFSWPPTGLADQVAGVEQEPNNDRGRVQKVTLPLDIAGSFFPAADVDMYEFEAKKGEVWWIEVASERLGRPTDPAILVQRVEGTGDAEKTTDVAEFSDIPSPVKVSSNGYAYDGPPYNAGSSDILGKLEIPQDGLYRLQITDLFGGTRSDPRNIYRLIIRKATPDFALVAWALHMELRNGDRNAMSKPLSLRGGATMALEVVAVRRDGFDGDIELTMEGLPAGVKAQGLKIPAGKSRGMMLVTAQQDAPRSLASVQFQGQSKLGDAVVVRPCRLASMAWPVPDAWSEIPSPRLLADVPVAVGGVELAPITIAPVTGAEVREASVGQKLVIPFKQTRRNDFSGATVQLRAIGAGFEQAPPFDLRLTDDTAEAVLDLAALKTPPGDYVVAFCGGAVAKYKPHSQPANTTDIVDIVVTEPIAIRVKPVENK